MYWYSFPFGGVHTMWGMMGFMGIGMIFWIALLAAVIYLIVHFASRPSNNANTNERGAVRILKERYARGEIDRETFMRMKDDLK